MFLQNVTNIIKCASVGILVYREGGYSSYVDDNAPFERAKKKFKEILVNLKNTLKGLINWFKDNIMKTSKENHYSFIIFDALRDLVPFALSKICEKLPQ